MKIQIIAVYGKKEQASKFYFVMVHKTHSLIKFYIQHLSTKNVSDNLSGNFPNQDLTVLHQISKALHGNEI